jgi:hypothetical protein
MAGTHPGATTTSTTRGLTEDGAVSPQWSFERSNPIARLLVGGADARINDRAINWLARDNRQQLGGATVRLRDGRYECTLCGAVLDIPTDQEPQVVIKAKSGSPRMRVILYNGKESHACPIGK